MSIHNTKIELLSELESVIKNTSKVNKRLSLTRLHDIVQGVITGEGDGTSYEDMYPLIKEPNCFSISTLAFQVQKQLDWKQKQLAGLTKEEKDGKVSAKMFSGRAIHRFLEHAVMKESDAWQNEMELRIHVPYQWQHLPPIKMVDQVSPDEIVIMGHMDLVNFSTNEIIEFKSSIYSDAITRYHRLQAGTYGHSMYEWAREVLNPDTKPFKVYISKVGGRKGVNEVLMGPREMEYAYSDLINRAFYCAKKLDLIYAGAEVPQPDKKGLDRAERKAHREAEADFIKSYHEEE